MHTEWLVQCTLWVQVNVIYLSVISRGIRCFCKHFSCWETALNSCKRWHLGGLRQVAEQLAHLLCMYNPVHSIVISLLVRLTPAQSWSDLDPDTNVNIHVGNSSLYSHVWAFCWDPVQCKTSTSPEYWLSMPSISTSRDRWPCSSSCPDTQHQDTLPPQGSREHQCLLNWYTLPCSMGHLYRRESWHAYLEHSSFSSSKEQPIFLHSIFFFLHILTVNNLITSKSTFIFPDKYAGKYNQQLITTVIQLLQSGQRWTSTLRGISFCLVISH